MISDRSPSQSVSIDERAGVVGTDRASLVQWARRALLQSEIASARELAGLTNDELNHLESEFCQSPTPRRAAWQREASPVGIALLLLAGFAFAAPELLVGISGFHARLAQIVGAALVLVGVLLLSARYILSLTGVPLDRAYSTLGLYVSELHDRHPWLYETFSANRHCAADEYRRKVIEERGLLRGADYVLMCEIVRLHEALDRARPASVVVEALQLLPAPPPPADDGGGPEPRLVPLTAVRRGQG